MSLQTLTLKLDGITVGDYLTWCRDPEPPALDSALRSISVDADPLGDTIIAILEWNQPPLAAPAAATAAGLALPAAGHVQELLTDDRDSEPVVTEAGPHSRRLRRVRDRRRAIGPRAAPSGTNIAAPCE